VANSKCNDDRISSRSLDNARDVGRGTICNSPEPVHPVTEPVREEMREQFKGDERHGGVD